MSVPTIPNVPFWGEMIIWSYAWGIAANLLLWIPLHYNLHRVRFAGWMWNWWNFLISNFVLAVVSSVLWPLSWALVIFSIYAGEAESKILAAMIGGALGLKSSLNWLEEKRYFPGIT